MGGEKWCVSMFGPRIKMDIIDWIHLLESNGEKYNIEYYKNSVYAYLEKKSGSDNDESYVSDDESHDNSYVFDVESDIIDKFDTILNKYKLDWSYESVYDWYSGICYVGYKNNNGEYPEPTKKEKMEMLCKKFLLPPPKFFRIKYKLSNLNQKF